MIGEDIDTTVDFKGGTLEIRTDEEYNNCTIDLLFGQKRFVTLWLFPEKDDLYFAYDLGNGYSTPRRIDEWVEMEELDKAIGIIKKRLK